MIASLARNRDEIFVGGALSPNSLGSGRGEIYLDLIEKHRG
ncbi:hypothetical protein LG3211_1433 [Lysobacter gummosus]|nr:hypothetical protein LG3211_1433 [Lysobacter gummosus]